MRLNVKSVSYVKRGCLIVHFLVGVVFVKHHSDGEFTSSLARFQQQGDRHNIVDLGDKVAVLVACSRLKSDQILERVDTVPWYDKFIQRTDNNGSFFDVGVSVSREKSVQVGHMSFVHMHLGATGVKAKLGADANERVSCIIEAVTCSLLAILPMDTIEVGGDPLFLQKGFFQLDAHIVRGAGYVNVVVRKVAIEIGHLMGLAPLIEDNPLV